MQPFSKSLLVAVLLSISTARSECIDPFENLPVSLALLDVYITIRQTLHFNTLKSEALSLDPLERLQAADAHGHLPYIKQDFNNLGDAFYETLAKHWIRSWMISVAWHLGFDSNNPPAGLAWAALAIIYTCWADWNDAYLNKNGLTVRSYNNKIDVLKVLTQQVQDKQAEIAYNKLKLEIAK